MIAVVKAHDLRPGDVLLPAEGSSVVAVRVGSIEPCSVDSSMVVVYEASVVPHIQRLRATLPVRVLRGTSDGRPL